MTLNGMENACLPSDFNFKFLHFTNSKRPLNKTIPLSLDFLYTQHCKDMFSMLKITVMQLLGVCEQRIQVSNRVSPITRNFESSRVRVVSKLAILMLYYHFFKQCNNQTVIFNLITTLPVKYAYYRSCSLSEIEVLKKNNRVEYFGKKNSCSAC